MVKRAITGIIFFHPAQHTVFPHSFWTVEVNFPEVFVRPACHQCRSAKLSHQATDPTLCIAEYKLAAGLLLPARVLD